MTDYGVDLFHGNPVTDWKAVRDSGISFAWLKATEGDGFYDGAFFHRASDAQNAGLRVSGYHFAHAGNVDAQVKTFCTALNGPAVLNVGNLAPMLDMEADDLRADANVYMESFIPRFRQMTGQRKLVVYANLDWFRNVLQPDHWADDDVTLWVADYSAAAGHPRFNHPNLGLHQFSRSGHVPGITGAVDLDAVLPGWTLDHFTITPAAPGNPGGTELMERKVIAASPETTSVRLLLSGSDTSAIIIRPTLDHDGFAVNPVWLGNVFAWGSDHSGVGHNPKGIPGYEFKVTSHRRINLAGAVWADLEYSSHDPFVIDIVG